MSNVTLAIEDDLLKRARDFAHRHDTTVNAMVREYLRKTVDDVEARKERAIRARQFREQNRIAVGKLPPAWRVAEEDEYFQRMYKRHGLQP